MTARWVLLPIFLLAACGPPDPMRAIDRAYDTCTDRARAATGPTGRIGIGISNDGPVGGLEVGISSDYILGRNPQDVYEQCFIRETGTVPTRPLIL